MSGLFTPSSLSLVINVLAPRMRMEGMALGLEPAALFSTITIPGVREVMPAIRFVGDNCASSSPLMVVAEPVNVSLDWV